MKFLASTLALVATPVSTAFVPNQRVRFGILQTSDVQDQFNVVTTSLKAKATAPLPSKPSSTCSVSIPRIRRSVKMATYLLWRAQRLNPKKSSILSVCTRISLKFCRAKHPHRYPSFQDLHCLMALYLEIEDLTLYVTGV